MDITKLYIELSDFGADTDHYPIGIALECGRWGAWVLTAEPHPFNEPRFTLWHGYVNPSTSTLRPVDTFHDIAEARAAFNARTEGLQ